MKTSENLYLKIKNILEEARKKTYRSINSTMVQSYWEIGREIVEEEQQGNIKAEYGIQLINNLSARLTQEYGVGFKRRNLFYMKEFYIRFPKVHALSAQLTWTHYRLIIKLEEKSKIDFYIAETINNNWSTRELDRQINSMLYERVTLSKDKEDTKKLEQSNQEKSQPEDIIKDPYVLEFLDLENKEKFSESDLEDALINNLKDFLIELGKGFAFVARQQRITLGNDHYYIDLVFYHYILKCFVLIELKTGRLSPKDIGQMDFYVRYFEKEFKSTRDSPTIGIILCADKNEAVAKYTLIEENKSIFASRYKAYLPSEEELKKEIEREKRNLQLYL